MKKSGIDMLHGPIWNKIPLFALPVAATAILGQLFNASDLAVVGNFAGEARTAAVAAVGANSSVVSLVVNLFTGVALGANVVIAGAIGREDTDAAQRAVHTALLFAVLGGFVIALIGELAAEPLLRMMSVPDEVLPLALLYLRIYLLGMPVILLYNFEAAIFRSIGDTKVPLATLAISGVINVILNLFFVIVLGMTVDGVAIATVLSNVVSCVVVVWMLCREKSEIRLSWRALRMDRALLGRMLAIGLPAGLQSTVFTFSNVCIQSTLNSFGTAAVAGSSAALNYEFFAYFPVVAFGQAAVTFSSQNFGAGQYDRCRKIFRQTMLLSLVCAEVMGLDFVFGKELFVRFFTAEAGVAEFAYIRMCTLLPFYFLVPLYEVGGAALRGIGHSLAPAVLTVLGTCVLRLIWVFTVCRIWPDYRVLMLVYPITWALTGAAIMVCYFLVDRKLAKKFLTAQTH